MVPLIQGIQNSQTHRGKEHHSGCQRLGGEVIQLLSEYNVSVMLDE